MGRRLAGPQPPEDVDPLHQTARPLVHRDLHRRKLGVPLRPAGRAETGAGVRPSPHARDEIGPALTDLIQRRPLIGQDDRVAKDEAGHTGRPEQHPMRSTGRRGEQDERVQPGLRDEAVSREDGVEHLGPIRDFRHREELARARGAQHDSAIRQAQSPAYPGSHLIPPHRPVTGSVGAAWGPATPKASRRAD